MKIGVFDSGVGGQSVANTVAAAIPDGETIYRVDKENIPYGNKSVKTLQKLVLPILQEMEREGCDVIVLACNTVTTNIAPYLREHIDIPLVGLEPMVKPAAALTKSGKIIVCATPMTLQSQRYAWLKQQYAPNSTIYEPDCSEWAAMIEANVMEQQAIRTSIEPYLKKGADVVVLGCTHYHWIESEIRQIADKYKAEVLQPEQAVVSQLKRVLAQLS